MLSASEEGADARSEVRGDQARREILRRSASLTGSRLASGETREPTNAHDPRLDVRTRDDQAIAAPSSPRTKCRFRTDHTHPSGHVVMGIDRARFRGRGTLG